MGNKPSFMLQDEEITLICEETGFSPTQIERLYSRFTALDKSGNGSLSRQDCLAIPELAINPLCDRIVQMFFIDCDDDHERINFRQFMKVLATFRASHKSSPLSRSRNVSRQESLNHQQRESILKQAPLLFDTIDPSALTRHSRHSSFHDGFNDNHHHHHHHHHTTNQHSIRYVASTTHLAPTQHLYSYNNNNRGNNLNNSQNNGAFKGSHVSLLDPDEPANSRKQKLFFMFKIYDADGDDRISLKDLIEILKMMVGKYIDDARINTIANRSLREADSDGDGFIDFEEFCNVFKRKDLDESLKVKFANSL